VSKRTSTRWYIGAWVAAVIGLAIAYSNGHWTNASTSMSPLTAAAWGVAMIAGLVMLVAWIGALIRLGQLHSWGWFAVVLALQLIGLGIIGILAYAFAGPREEMVVTRPTVTGG
jgi:ABC-type nitrate/sulfonate/bicarbonate transport system permease component